MRWQYLRVDSNSIAQLIAAFKESQVAPAAISQNSVLIATMITALVGQMFLQLLGYLKSKSADENALAAKTLAAESGEELKKIHVAVNSASEAGRLKSEGLEKKVMDLLQDKATSDEKQRVQITKDAVAAAVTPTPSVTELSPAVIAQIVKAIKEAS